MSKRPKRDITITRKISYMWDMQNQLFSMFDYDKIPFRKEFLEWELQRMGFVAMGKYKDKIYVGSIVWTEYDDYGLPKEGSNVEFWTRYGFRFNGILGKDIIIGYNNDIRTPETSLLFFSDLFTEIDKSIKANVMISRTASIPVAKDDKTKKAIDEIMEDIEDGKTRTIASGFLLDELLDGEKEIVKMLHLTQPEQIERVQYLSKLHDDLNRRFWCKYGVSMNTNGKMAQVNEMELQGNDEYAHITPYTMLNARKELIGLCNKTFGTDYSVDFGKAWQHLKENKNSFVDETKKENETESEEVKENENIE